MHSAARTSTPLRPGGQARGAVESLWFCSVLGAGGAAFARGELNRALVGDEGARPRAATKNLACQTSTAGFVGFRGFSSESVKPLRARAHRQRARAHHPAN